MDRLDEGWKSEALVRTFIDGIRGGIPLGAVQSEVAGLIVAATVGEPESFLDLGCGDGVLSEALLALFPKAEATLVDFSAPMLAEARKRFSSKTPAPKIVEADFSAKDWAESVKGPFDLVISGYAIHHQSDEIKRRIYAEIFALLRPGGLFINIDHVKARSEWALKTFDEYLSRCLKEFNADKGTPELYEKMTNLTDDRKKKEADVIATVEAQCDWLREIGFTDVDCHFKIFELALFAGLRPA
ncbi:MAG: class I SAM-dependent methyltransferase [Thermodesulfobacteriota bacterium]